VARPDLSDSGNGPAMTSSCLTRQRVRRYEAQSNHLTPATLCTNRICRLTVTSCTPASGTWPSWSPRIPTW